MLLGHIAVGFAARRAAPRASLTMLVFAAQFVDLLWPLLLWTGVERVRIAPGNTVFSPLEFENYPVSHSLLLTLVWAVPLALLYWWKTGYVRGAWCVAVAVTSHWVLDFLSHGPDLPLFPSGPRYGLGLWNHPVATMTIEGLMFAVGLGFYLSGTRAKGWMGHLSLWSLVAILTLLYVGSATGPPPPNVTALKIVGTAFALFLFWFWWVDRTRETRPGLA